MDFWSRLIGGGARAKPASSITPQQRLARFKRASEQLSQIWRRIKSNSLTTAAEEDTRMCLSSLKRMLLDESRATSPYLCIEYAATTRTYTAVADLASLLTANGVAQEAIGLLNVLVESEEGDFLQSPAFSSAVTSLAKRLLLSGGLYADAEASLFELLFSVAAKLKQQPSCLGHWFRPYARRREADTPELSKNVSPHSRESEFQLFYLLLDNVLHERRVGEFARTGLLYVVETSIRSEVLEKWIVESDFAALLASGLGALYSQMSRKLVFSYIKGTVPAVITFSEAPRSLHSINPQDTSPADSQNSVTIFLTYLAFWQDLLEHCTSSDIKQTLLDHFEFLFLQQLLYPSLLESSDLDGSSVAVLTYLRLILESLSYPDLVRKVLNYLLASNRKMEGTVNGARPAALARRRKSQILVTQQAEQVDQVSPQLFSLVDLIVTSLRSNSQQTVTATLRLLATLLSSQHQYAFQHLTGTSRMHTAIKPRSMRRHGRNIDILLDMADSLVRDDGLEASYDAYLEDAGTLIETHACSSELLALSSLNISEDRKQERGSGNISQANSSMVQSKDPLLQSLFSLLDDFLGNDIETNLGLTRVLSCLASCGSTSLEGWLLISDIPGEINTDEDLDSHQSTQQRALSEELGSRASSEDDENQQSHNGFNDVPSHRNEITSPLFVSLDRLVRQVHRFSKDIEDFDTYLAERKHVFEVGDEIEIALKDTSEFPRRAQGPKATSPPRKRNRNQATSISERLLSGDNSATVSRSSTPRGRQRDEQIVPTLVGRLSHLRISPSASPSRTASSAHSPSPFRKGSLSSTPPQGLRSPVTVGNALRQKMKISTNGIAVLVPTPDARSDDGNSVRSDSIGPETRDRENVVEISLSHLLTNVIILQEFLLELAAIIEVRASLFGEVALD